MTASGGRVGVLRAGALSMLALAALGLTRLLHGSLVSHRTDPATYGLVGSLIAITMIASLLLPGGVSSAASKFIAFHRGAGDPAAARTAYRYLNRLGTASAVVLGALAGLAAWAMFRVPLSESLAVGVLTAAYSMYTVDKSSMYGFGRVSQYARLELFTSALAVAATVVVVAGGFTGYLLPLAIGYAVFVVGAKLILRRDTVVRNESEPTVDGGGRSGFDRREVFGYVAVASVGTLAATGFLQGTQLLASRLISPYGVGLVAAAVALVAPMYFLPRALSVALFPAMAGAHGAGDADEVRRQADVSTRALMIVPAPIFVAALMLAPEVLTVFGGATFADGAGVLRLMFVAAFLGVIAVPAVNALSSGERRRARMPATAAVTGCLVGLAGILLLAGVAGWGANGVGAGYLAGSAVTALVPVALVWRYYTMPWWGPILRSLGLVASFALGGQILDRVMGGPPLVDIGLAAAAVLICVAVLWPDVRWLRAVAGQRGRHPAEPVPAAAEAELQRLDATRS